MRFFLRPLTVLLLLIAAATTSDLRAAGVSELRPAEPVVADSISSTISGFVRDSANGEPIIGASVQIKALKRGARTNKSGYFVLYVPSNVEHLVEISSIGYSPFRTTIRLGPDDKKQLDIKLRTAAFQGGEVTVERDRDREREAPKVSTVTINPQQVAQLPKAGEADLFRTLQLIPGVKTSSEISSGLYIRGGSPDQNLILLDGSVLYNPSHFFGFFSTFNSDAIKDVELIKGGYPAEYGGRLSAVLSVTNKDGDREETHGKFSIGLISSRATVETPLGTGAVTLSGRRTYLDAILAATGLKDELDLPDYNFYDLNAKITQNPSNGDKIALSGYLGRDILDFSDPAAGASVLLKWGNKSASLDWMHLFNDNLFSQFNLSASSYFSNLTLGSSGEDFIRDNDILDYTLNGALEYSPNEDHQFKFGFQSTMYNFTFLVKYGKNPPSANVDLSPFYGAVYLQDEWKLSEQAAVNAGLRIDGISSRPEIGIDPRVSMRYILNSDVTLKASFGVYHQYLRLATNPNISFFDVWLPVDSTQPPARSEQYILGVATTPWEGYTLEVEGYYKKLHDIVELRPNIVNGARLSDVFFLGDGYSYGIELFL
ncbi:MAG TPA: TonB-dependent receptor, partial [Candidatus Kapabacteria bacterium]|nr:TonB-dependent receptor [Candidatus Kapabacteria bacterium]